MLHKRCSWCPAITNTNADHGGKGVSKNQRIESKQVMESLFANVKAANTGDRDAINELGQSLTGRNFEAIVNVCGDLAYQAEESTLHAMLGDQKGYLACVRQKLKTMRIDWGWNEASEMERVLIERVVATWLSLQFAEIKDSQSKSESIAKSKYLQHRIDRAQRRHLSAIKMLATVRKLALPTLVDVRAQINVVDNCLGHVENIAVNPTK
tara:strand:+ start:102 stop:731 length:630 start_codon:yes stop_codon:yes gene_type:complete